MKADIKALWVEALRSGEFEQTTGQLHDKRGFCCLGVLCELHRRETASGEWAPANFNPGSNPQTYLGEELLLPRVVMDWAGLKVPNPSVLVATETGDSDGERCVSALNDNGWQFGTIADKIENHLNEKDV